VYDQLGRSRDHGGARPGVIPNAPEAPGRPPRRRVHRGRPAARPRRSPRAGDPHPEATIYSPSAHRPQVGRRSTRLEGSLLQGGLLPNDAVSLRGARNSTRLGDLGMILRHSLPPTRRSYSGERSPRGHPPSRLLNDPQRQRPRTPPDRRAQRPAHHQRADRAALAYGLDKKGQDTVLVLRPRWRTFDRVDLRLGDEWSRCVPPAATVTLRHDFDIASSTGSPTIQEGQRFDLRDDARRRCSSLRSSHARRSSCPSRLRRRSTFVHQPPMLAGPKHLKPDRQRSNFAQLTRT